MSEYVGEACAQVRVRRRPLMYVGPAQRHMDIDVRGYSSLFDSANIKQDNVMVHKSVGAVTVKPLIANRDNYIVESNKPNKNYIVTVPRGASRESTNEINKRVFRSYPNEFQLAARGGSNFGRGGYVEPGATPEDGDQDDSPRFRDQDLPPIFSADDGERYPVASWVLQDKASGNVEWFLMQEYGNFANEPFWVDLYKFEKQEPFGPKGDLEDRRYAVYGADRELHAYFGFRLGWTASEDIKNIDGSNLLRVKNNDNARIGPYDIIFPIDGTPFIYDHQGESNEEETSTRRYQYRDGFVVSEAPDASWTMTDDMDKVRLFFWVLRGKLVITSTHTDVPWVFPSNISPQASSDTRNRYQNFCIPPGKVCFFGRGFAWRMSFNPTEFNIYDNRGRDLEQQRGYHGKMRFLPLIERTEFPSGGQGGWRDYSNGRSSINIDSGRSGKHNFTILPDDRFRDPSNISDTSMLTYAFGWDVVTEPYFGLTASAAGDVTSMMIPVQGDIFKPKSGTSGNNPRDLVNAYLDSPSRNDDISSIDNLGSEFGFDTSISGINAAFQYKIPTVELNCRAPEFRFGSQSYTENISKRFASPVFWAMKGVHYTPAPPAPDWIDITNTISNISYETSCSDLQSFNQSMSVQVIVPKDYQFQDFELGDGTQTYTDSVGRDNFIDLFYSGVLEIEVAVGWLNSNETQEPALHGGEFGVFRGGAAIRNINVNGHAGKVAPMFRGLAYAGPLQQTFAYDTINLNCKDFLTVLEHQIILNSPIFDGLATDNAFYEVGMLGGLPRNLFDVRSASAARHILPMAFTFQNPKIKFEKNTKIIDAVKQIAQYFMHIIRSDPDGRIVLGDIYHPQEDVADGNNFGVAEIIDEQPLTHPSYEFYVDGGFGWKGQGGPPNPWQRCYETFNFDKSIEDQLTQLLILTVDRDDGALIMDNRALDLAAIENPNANNFIGYSKMGRYQQPALGDRKHLQQFKEAFAERVFTAPLKISFTTYGRPTLRALDIIGVYHTHDLNLNLPVGNDPPNFLKYRVLSVKGSIQWDDGKYQYRCDVTAEHL